MKIRKSIVAGHFYSSSKEELVKKIEAFTENFKKEANYDSRAVIVPHAGHEYSGALAAKGYQYLKKDLETLIIFSPAHRYAVKSFALPTDDAWEVPNGTVLIDKETIEKIKNIGGEYCDEAFINEHSIEVQLPFIKHYFPTAKIVPILVGGADYKTLSNIISEFWKDEKIGFVISSDLSHFRNKKEAMRIDNVTADMIEKS
ncbi:MAG: AmmeMemoRadiSam system protein B, partial [Candidatus Gastranaerophilaceae bacterium]